jgi:hypothetical protein
MNQVSQHIMSIYHYSVLVRDTLEYTIVKDAYNLEAFEQRKKALKVTLEEKSPLRHFIDTNGETGKTIETKIREFIDDVYGDDSTILRPSADGLRVDHAQHLKIYDYVVGIHETLSDITKGYVKFARDNKQEEPDVERVITDDERLYRGLVFMTVMADVDKTFLEFNKAMRETKGQPSPQSNYIIGDLKKLIGFLGFQKQHNTIRDAAFNDMMDHSFRVLEQIEGKRELPAMPLSEEEKNTYKGKLTSDGQRYLTFPEIFKENHDIITKVVATSEENWRKSYQPVMTVLLAATAAKNALPKAPGGNA